MQRPASPASSSPGPSVTNLTVAVLIPTYNRWALLHETVASLLAQTRTPNRILVIDDGCDEDLSAGLTRLDTSISCLRKANGGKAAALNFGLQYVVEDAVWIFDDDDLARPDALEKLEAAMLRDPSLDYAYGGFVLFEINEVTAEKTLRPFEMESVQGLQTYPALLERSFIFQGAMLVRTEGLRRVGHFDESLIRCQDYDSILRIARVLKGVQIPDIVFEQRHHRGLRGSRAQPIQIDQVDVAVRRFDQIIMRKMLPQTSLQAYIGFADDAPLSPVQEASARLRRLAILGRKDMWDEFKSELPELCALCRSMSQPDRELLDVSPLEAVFGFSSRALPGFLNDPASARALRTLTPAWLSGQLRRALLGPWLFRMRWALQHRRPRDVRDLMGVLMSLEGAGQLPRLAVTRLARKLKRLRRDSTGSRN